MQPASSTPFAPKAPPAPIAPRCLRSLLAALLLASAAAAEPVALFDGHGAPAVVYAADGGTPIAKVAELLGRDLQALTGTEPVVTPVFDRATGPAVIVGRADSPAIATLLQTNRISTAEIVGKWETYGRVVIPAPWNARESALLIFGSDTRGTIWGVIDLTRELGVSPWEWWADVVIRRTDRLTIDGALHYSREPSVKYRGIFLNAGGNGLNPWAGKTYDPAVGNMGPKTYARIFELLWRLKANALWPAMTTDDTPFNAFPENAQVAADYAIVRGSSHVEMLLRTNPREWDPQVRGPYNWIINRAEMIRYWTEAVERFGKFENLYTVGLRNVDDFPMQGVNTPEAMGDVLTDVIAEQRKILTSVRGRPAEEAPQVFTAYKEVLDAYDTGHVQLPADITLNWPDDNFGYIRRLSTPEERRRSGGAGIYYHNVFWGSPMSYLLLTSTHPALAWEEMTKAHAFDARQLWIVNVGSIKPGEFFTQFFLDLAFDVPAFAQSTSVRAYLRRWSAETFGPADGDRIAGILWEYYRLAFDRAPEFMAWTEVFPETSVRQTEFNLLDFGDENERRASAYRALMAQVRELMVTLPADRQAAFFELVGYQVMGAANLNLRQLALDKTIAYGLQRRASANLHAAEIPAAQERIAADCRYFNEEIAGGKWRHFVSPVPHPLPLYELPHVPTWDTHGDARCGVQVEGGGYFNGTGWWTPDLPAFHPELQETRYIDVFAQGAFETTWTAKATAPINVFRQDKLDLAQTTPAPWIKLSKTSGRFSPAAKHLEDRIEVSIDWAAAPAGGAGEVILSGPAFPQPVAVHVRLARPNSVPNVSFLEANRIVSIHATHADTLSAGWEILDGLGHTGATLRARLDLPSIDPADEAAVRRAPHAVYRFATTTTRDRATLSAVALPTFPITTRNGVRLAVSIDDGPLQVLDFAAPEFSAAWRQHALTNKAIERLPDLRLAAGAHTLTVYALDPGVTLDWFEIAFAGAARAYGPPPETRIVR